MDLVGFSQETFTQIERDFRAFFHGLDVDGNDATTLHFVPVSALAGDNVVHRSGAMHWYSGPTLLALLESIPSSQVNVDAPFRLAVQRVVRPDLDFRGFAGQIASGRVSVGDELAVRPGGRRSRVRRIVTFDGDLQEAHAPLSVTLTLEDEVDISRGDLLVTVDAQPMEARTFEASLVWMDATPLDLSRRYLLKQGSRTVHAYVRTLVHTVDLNQLAGQLSHPAEADTLPLNAIGNVVVEVLQPLVFDRYGANRHTGSFVLIDLQTNATVAAGMIRRADAGASSEIDLQHASVVLKQGGALRLDGSAAAIKTAMQALRTAGVLDEETA